MWLFRIVLSFIWRIKTMRSQAQHTFEHRYTLHQNNHWLSHNWTRSLFLYLLFSLSQIWRIYQVVRFVSQLSAICLFHSALFSVFHLCPLDHNFHDTKILLIRYFMRPKLFVWCTRRMRLRNYWILFIVCTIINKWRKKKCVVSVTPKHGGVLYDSYCNSQCYCQYGCLLLLRCWENMSLSRSTATHKTNKKCNLSRRSTSIQIGSNLIRLSSPIDCYLVHLE